ncbi:MAG: ribonuclease III family protein [Methanophagales archaeon ANME-1-THS]|nr:MAG: ribonuclease III family protein [Methanophagales archaeon ANME-1-THS]
MEQRSNAASMKDDLTDLEELIGHRFQDKALLAEAITVGSYTTEHPGSPNYQRLEFLGDRVISLIVTEQLLASQSLDEGKMTILRSELENNQRMAEYGEEIGLRRYIRAGEKREQISSKVIADIFEAICGAIYLDTAEPAKMSEVEKFLAKFKIFERIKEKMAGAADILPVRNQFENKFRDVHRCNPEIEFEYRSTGEEHQKRWTIKRCWIKDPETGEEVELEGVKNDTWFTNKKDAETDALEQAFRYLEARGWHLKRE